MGLFFNKKKAVPKTAQVQDVPLNEIVPNRFQPRKVFTKDAIAELAETIQAHGLLQPIILREYGHRQYEIIAGERRFRAMQSLKMAAAPAIVQTMTDEESAAMALIENLQREGLNAIEEAQAYVELMKLNKLTQQALAEQMGKSQSFVANKLRLLKLSEAAQQAVMHGEISERHGRELLRLDDYHQQLVLHQVMAEHLTVKETHAAVEALVNPQPEPEVTPEPAGQPEPTPEPKATKKATKPKRKVVRKTDPKVALATLNESVKLIQNAGVKATVNRTETATSYQVVIEIPKEG